MSLLVLVALGRRDSESQGEAQLPSCGIRGSAVICLRLCSPPRAQNETRALLTLFSGEDEKQTHWVYALRWPLMTHVRVSPW